MLSQYGKLTLSLVLAAAMAASGQENILTSPARGLIYSATADFRHDSIPTAIQALKTQGTSYNITFDQTEDQGWFTDERLAQYDVIVFLQNTGEVLDESGQEALEKYVNMGGNFAAIHAASDCLRNSTFMDKEIGAHFDYHPEIQNATIDVIGPAHPSTAMLPAQWHVFDEMYNFKSDPRSVGAIVILSANESSYTDPGPRTFNQGSPHPTAWFQEHGAGAQANSNAGRSFYTSLGHTNQTWQDELYLAHVMNGISWTIQSGTTKAMNSSAVVGSSASVNSTTSGSTSIASTSGANTATSSQADTTPVASQNSQSSQSSGGPRTSAQIVTVTLITAFMVLLTLF